MKYWAFILFIALLAGCATEPSVITKSRAIDIARQNVQYHDGYWWADHATYSASRTAEGGWNVRVEFPDRNPSEGSTHAGGAERAITIDPYGNVTNSSNWTKF